MYELCTQWVRERFDLVGVDQHVQSAFPLLTHSAGVCLLGILSDTDLCSSLIVHVSAELSKPKAILRNTD